MSGRRVLLTKWQFGLNSRQAAPARGHGRERGNTMQPVSNEELKANAWRTYDEERLTT
jgi:hypothetical protein